MPYYDYPTFRPDEILEYLRKSRSDDPILTVEEVLAKHENILAEWAGRNLSGPIPEQNIYREVVSGETIDDRPEMLRLLKMIESPKVKAILAVEVQRLSRGDLEDAGRLIKLLRYTNTMIITPVKTYDLKDDYDRDAFERELKRGNEFLEYQKKIMNRGRLLSVSQGNFIGSIPPYGYDRAWVMDGKRKCPTLSINEKEAPVLRMIFDLYVNQNMGLALIARRLNELGIKPRKAARWNQAAIKEMLENVHYIGKVRWNWRQTVVSVEDMEVYKTRPKKKMGDYLVYEGKHEPIVSEELFKAAQEKQGRNHRAKVSVEVRNPLAGLIYCQCGRAMSLRTYKKNGIERSAPRMLCDNQAYCHTGSCLFDEMVDRVCNILQSCITDFEIQLQNSSCDVARNQANLIRQLESRLEDLEHKEISQWEKYSEEGMPKHIFDKLNEKVLREKEEVQAALHQAYEARQAPLDYEEKLHRFREALDALMDSSISAGRKNILLKSCINRITYNRQRPEQRRESDQPLARRGSPWTAPPIELDVDLRI